MSKKTLWLVLSLQPYLLIDGVRTPVRSKATSVAGVLPVFTSKRAALKQFPGAELAELEKAKS